MLNSTLIHEINPLWSWCIVFIIYLVLVSSYFALEYCIYDHIQTGPILFCLCGFICFWNQYFTSLIKWAKKLLFFFYFIKVLFFKSLIELIWKAIWGFGSGEGLSAIISVSLVSQVFSVAFVLFHLILLFIDTPQSPLPHSHVILRLCLWRSCPLR